MQCTGRQMSANTGEASRLLWTTALGSLNLIWLTAIEMWKRLYIWANSFIILFQCLQKTINECENKCRFYNTEMPLALVSPHLLPETPCSFFFFPTFLHWSLKNKERTPLQRLCPVWLHRLYTVTTSWTCMKYAHRNIITLKWQQIRGVGGREIPVCG